MGDGLRVLVVDDEAMSARIMARQLISEGYLAQAETSAIKATERLASEPFDVVVSDLRMPHMDGLDFLRIIRERNPNLFVIMMSAFGTVDRAVELMVAGASDFLTKPFPLEVLTVRLEKLRELCEARREINALRARLHEGGGEEHDLVGGTSIMQQVRERIATFANSSVPVLITGETGTGKELVARSLHGQGPRWEEPFIAVACGAIPAELAESELFGHVRGAFTGAIKDRRGVFQRAHGGTLLLDDVDDLPSDIQVKLLRVLEEGTLSRVGSEEEVRVDVRLVATTKVDLATSEHGFREDLYFRMRGLEIDLPPLRVRGDDIIQLAVHFLAELVPAAGAPPHSLGEQTVRCLKGYRWPGNVRELKRTMESAVVLSAGGEILSEHLPDHVRQHDQDGEDPRFALNMDGVSQIQFRDLVGRFEAEVLRWALYSNGGNQIKAAKALGLPRTTFQNKIKSLS